MALEVIAAAATAVAGVIGLLLWVDGRVTMAPAARVVFTGLVLVTVTAVAVALRVTALRFPLGAVAGVILALAAWTLVVLLTTRPAPAYVEGRGKSPRGSRRARRYERADRSGDRIDRTST